MTVAPPSTNEPYCSNCGYVLTNLTQSSKCPECGRPLVEVLTRRNAFAETGRRYQSKAMIFGLPLIDIAVGPKNGQMRGKARGFIAIGDFATGFLAIGGVVRGVVAIGGVAAGLFALGGLSLGLFTALGGVALGGLASGGIAGGGASAGGLGAGFMAQGGLAIGYYARGGKAWGMHTVSMGPMPPGSPSQAEHAFGSMSWFYGAWPPNSASTMQPMLVTGGSAIVVGVFLMLAALMLMRKRNDHTSNWPAHAIR
jgi:hypothetical protein